MARTWRHDVPMSLAVMPGADIDARPDSGGRPHPTLGVVPEPGLKSVAGLHHDGWLHYMQAQLAFQNPQLFQSAVPEPGLKSVAGLHHDGWLHYMQAQLAFQNPQPFQATDARFFVEVDHVDYIAGDHAPVRLRVAVGELTDCGRVGAGFDLPCADDGVLACCARLLGVSVKAAAGACVGLTVDAVAGVDGAKAFSQGDQS